LDKFQKGVYEMTTLVRAYIHQTLDRTYTWYRL